MSIILYERQILKPPHLTLLQALQHPFLLHLKFTFLKTNFQSGNVLWQSRPLSKVIAYSSSALSYDQTTLYVGSYDNSLYAISARNGSISWRFPTGYLMFCFLNTLKLWLIPIWLFLTGNHILSSPLVASDIFIGSNDGYVYAISSRGVLRWKKNLGAAVHSSPSISSDGSVLYIGCADGKFRALNVINGDIIWTIATTLYINSSPAVDDKKTIYIGSADKHMYAISPFGLLKWRFLTGGIKHWTSNIITRPWFKYSISPHFPSWTNRCHNIIAYYWYQKHFLWLSWQILLCDW